MRFSPLNENALVVPNSFLRNVLSKTQTRGLKDFLSLQITQRAHHRCTSSSSHSPHILPQHSSYGDRTRFHKQLQAQIIDSLGCKNDICARCEDFLDSCQGDLGFFRTDLFELRGVVDLDVHAQGHSCFLEIYIKTCNFGVLDSGLHSCKSVLLWEGWTLRGDCAV